MNKVFKLFSIVAFILIFGLLIYIYQQMPAKRTVFVDTIELFNEFTFTKELTKEVENVFLKRKQSIDSMEVALKIKKDDKLQEKYIEERELLLQDYHHAEEVIKEKVWERLNVFINDFGKNNTEYILIIGANGMGTVLYGSEETNITSEVVKYVNTKYQGK